MEQKNLTLIKTCDLTLIGLNAAILPLTRFNSINHISFEPAFLHQPSIITYLRAANPLFVDRSMAGRQKANRWDGAHSRTVINLVSVSFHTFAC